jgi:hypothetical protein
MATRLALVKAFVAVATLAACGSSPAPTATATHGTSAPAASGSAAEAAPVEPTLATGQVWQLDDILGKLDEAGLRRAVVDALRDPQLGTCKLPATECAPEPGDVALPGEPTVEPETPLTAPCAKRLIPLRAVHLLTRDDVLAVGDDRLAAIARADPLLAQPLIGRIDQVARDHVLPLLIAAHDAGVPAMMLSVDSLDDAGLATAAAHHLYGMDGSRYSRATQLATLADASAPASARGQAMAALVPEGGHGKLPGDVHAAVLAAAEAPECSLAAQAAYVLADHGDASRTIKRPRDSALSNPKQAGPAGWHHAIEENARAVCLVFGARIAGWNVRDARPLFALLDAYTDPRAGLIVETKHLDAHEPPRTDAPVVYARGKFRPDEFDQDLMALLASCRGAHCAYKMWTADLTFGPARDGGAYLLRVDVVARDSSVCGGP